ncbi:TonB-dependent receptor [Sandaracinobacteroides hominis]|uniref:TonB-dependent receptor n=1 Tax=Sandaracinobacteroides hominis TaxID=2780086 RepID=UPI0018F6EBA8|nr:TonB-dependent receptor [Sandaracinobacteroides hominis]
MNLLNYLSFVATPLFLVQTLPAIAAAPDLQDPDIIVVTATRSERALEDVPAAVAVQDMDTLRVQGFTTGTDEFRGVTGVSFRRGEGDGDVFPFVSIRGSTGTDGFLALLDGVPFVGAFEEPLLADIPYDAVERIEVVKGPLSALYGRGAIYGGVNYITRSPAEDSLRASIGAGNDGYYRGSATLSRKLGEKGGLLLGGAYEQDGGWRENSERRNWSLYAKFDFDLGEKTRLGLSGSYLNRDIEMPNGVPLDSAGRVLAERKPLLALGEPGEQSKGYIGTATLEQGIGERFTLKLTGQYRNFERNNFLNFYDAYGLDTSRNVFGVNGFRGNPRQRVLFGEASLSADLGAHKLIGGISYEDTVNRTLSSWSGQNGFTPQCGFTFFLAEIDWNTGEVVNRNHPCFVVDQVQTDARFHDRFFGAFIQDEISLTDRLLLTLGGRFDSFRRHSEFAPLPSVGPGGEAWLKSQAFSPKASLSWRTGFGQVYAAYGRGFNSNFGPAFENDPVQYYRPELKPTTIDSVEVGVKGRALGDTLRFEAALYQTWQKNRRTSIPNPAAEDDWSAPPTLITFGQRYDVTGVEVALDIRPVEGTNLRVQYSHIAPKWGELILSGGQDLSGKTPTGVAPNIVFLSADQRITSWLSAGGTLEFYDDYAVTTDNSLFAGGYELVSLNARIAPESWRGISLDLSVTNLFDKEYYFYFGGVSTPTYATPGPPRQLRATVKAAF